MNDGSGIAKLVPGFDFLQTLAKTAGAAIPGMGGFGQWVAPTLDPAEIEKRIDELKTVQYWLEQNARMLAATIQALEVQRMTLSTLKTMNVQLGEMKAALPGQSRPAAPAARATSAAAASKGLVDPMQWWNALTSQFTQLATEAIKDGATDAAKTMASGMLRASAEGAAETWKRAAAIPARVAGAAGAVAAGAATQALKATKPKKSAGKSTKGRARAGASRPGAGAKGDQRT